MIYLIFSLFFFSCKFFCFTETNDEFTIIVDEDGFKGNLYKCYGVKFFNTLDSEVSKIYNEIKQNEPFCKLLQTFVFLIACFVVLRCF